MTGIPGMVMWKAWYGPIRSYRVERASDWQRLRQRGLAQGVCWVLVESGVWSLETMHERALLRPGGIAQIRLGTLEGRPAMGREREWSGRVLVLEGAKAVRHAEVLRGRYGWLHELTGSAREQLTEVLEKVGRESSLAEDRLAHEWLMRYQNFLEENHLPYHQVLKLDTDDERLEAFAGLSVKDLALGLSCTRSYLTRRLKQVWGRDPGEVLRDLRLRRAATLLKTTELPVLEIALGAGYRSLSGFYAAFERKYETTPSEYRDRCGGETTRRPAKVKDQRPEGASEAPVGMLPMHKGGDGVQTTDWDGPYFQVLTCGIAEGQASRVFDISLSTIVRRLTVVITLEGSAEFHTGQRVLTVRRGTALSYAVPMNAQWVVEPSRNWKRVWIQFSGELAEAFFGQVWESFGNVHKLNMRGMTVGKALAMRERVAGADYLKPVEWSHLAFEWLDHWKQELFQMEPQARIIRLDGLDLNGSEIQVPKTLKQYSRMTGYSVSHLQTKMTAQWKYPPGQTLRHARLDLAARLLRTESCPVSVVATQAGYATTSAFIRAFTRRFKVTPLRYRQLRRVV